MKKNTWKFTLKTWKNHGYHGILSVRKSDNPDGFEGEVCYSVTHKVQFNVNCQIIS